MSTATLDRPPADPATDTAKRRQILEGARAVFLQRGFDGASMNEIAKVAGVSKGTLYVYFDAKEALFEALTLAEREGLAEALFSLDEANPDVRAVLRGLGHSFIAAMLAPDHVSSLRMVIGAVDKFPRFGRLYYEAGPRNGIMRLKRYLDRQVEAGRLVADDTEMAAEQFLNLCSAGILKRALFTGECRHESAEADRVIDAAVRVFFAAYGAPGG